MPRRASAVLFAAGLLWLLQSAVAGAQELAPRAYWPAPVGTKLWVTGYQYSTGDIVTDPTLPFDGVQSDLNYVVLGFQRFDELFGRTASVQVSVPYVWGTTDGYVFGAYRNRQLAGTGDLRVRAAVNLFGAPAMDREGMRALIASPRPQVGVSLTVSLPTGSYDGDYLLNEGTHRWAFKPAAGVILPLRPSWLFEFELGAWLFGNNDDFLGQTRHQDPIWSAEAHLVKVLRPDIWMSLDLNHYEGGETWNDDGPKSSLQRNRRGGLTLVFPLGGARALKLSYSRGLSVRSGGDFEMYVANYAIAWR